MRTIKIQTPLVGRLDVFRLIAVSEATGLPALLVGPPGTGKTRALLDYAKAVAPSREEAFNNSFILETDEGTKTNEVKGRIDMEALTVENKYKIDSPITKAKFIMINEIDKASPGLRNALLGVMNEKLLFNGKEKIRCVWDVFVASCNIIPKDEINNPLWDRFVFKHKLNRVAKTQLMKYYKNRSEGKLTVHDVTVPGRKEVRLLEQQIPEDKLKAFMDTCYDSLTDRTISYIPKIAAAVSLVYDMTLVRALIKTAELLISTKKANQLADVIEPPELAHIRGQIEIISSLTSYDQIQEVVADIRTNVVEAGRNGSLMQTDIESLGAELDHALQNNPAYTMMEGESDLKKLINDNARYGSVELDTSTGYSKNKPKRKKVKATLSNDTASISTDAQIAIDATDSTDGGIY